MSGPHQVFARTELAGASCVVATPLRGGKTELNVLVFKGEGVAASNWGGTTAKGVGYKGLEERESAYRDVRKPRP